MTQLPVDNPAKLILPSACAVAGRTLAARRFTHAVAARLVGVGLAIGAVGLTVDPVLAQTIPEERAAPAVALEAHAEDGASSLLPLLSETVSVRIDDGHATASYVHVFRNDSAARLEGNYRLQVGEGATATGFAYYNGEEKIVGEIFERDSARQVYDAITGLRRDPGLLEQSGEGGFSFHVFPIEPGEPHAPCGSMTGT